jgi:hypothetical protein
MIAADHLTKRYGTVAAVDGLGFEVQQSNGMAIARRAVVLAGRCGTGDDRYSRRVGSRSRRGPAWSGADAGQMAGPVVVPGPGSCHGDLRDHRAGGPLLQRLVKGPALGAGPPRSACHGCTSACPAPAPPAPADNGEMVPCTSTPETSPPAPSPAGSRCVILAVGTGESVPKRPRPARLAARRGLRSTHDAAREQA